MHSARRTGTLSRMARVVAGVVVFGAIVAPVGPASATTFSIDSFEILDGSNCSFGQARATVTIADCNPSEPPYWSYHPRGGAGGIMNACSLGEGTRFLDVTYSPLAPIGDGGSIVVSLAFSGPDDQYEREAVGFNCQTGASLACPPTPRADCRSAGFSKLELSRKRPKYRFAWLWKKGEATSVEDLADPTLDADYDLCVYTEGKLHGAKRFPADPELWSATRSGFRRKEVVDLSGGWENSRSIVKIKAGPEGKPLVSIRESRALLPQMPLPLRPPVTVQFANSASGACFESSFDAEDIKSNTAGSGDIVLFSDEGKFRAVAK